MASISRQNNRWRVRQYTGRVGGKSIVKVTSFPSEAEARAFMASLPPSNRRPHRKPRTAAQVTNLLGERSALTDTGCLEWQGPLTTEGYGRFTWRPDGDLIAGAHRVAYHLLVAPVTRDKVIDHLCRNRACIRPDHLDLVTQRENVMRSPIAPGALNAAKTHCAHGHPYSRENTYVYTSLTRSTTYRICKTCTRNRTAAKARRAAKAATR